jgi:hypothetical protein
VRRSRQLLFVIAGNGMLRIAGGASTVLVGVYIAELANDGRPLRAGLVGALAGISFGVEVVGAVPLGMVGPYPCVIALLALEIGLDASVKQGLTLREPARAVLDGATTLASVGLIFGFFVRHIEDVTDELDPFLATPALWQLEIARASSEGHLHVQGRDPDALANVDRRRWLLVDVAATIAVTSNGKGQGTTFTVRLSTIDDEHAAPLSDSRDTADRRLHRRAVE